MQSIYEIDVEHSVHDFLFTDQVLANLLTRSEDNQANHERLLIHENEDGLDLSLFISSEIMQHLEDASPEDLLNDGKYAEYCLMLEGVSHFLYVVWNANHDKKVTLLEMELQAEIDKFVVLQSLTHIQHDANLSGDLQNWLFEKHSFDNGLSDGEIERYRNANHYAGKFCMNLQQQFNLNELNNDLLRELRRFYRMTQEDKFRYINNKKH